MVVATAVVNATAVAVNAPMNLGAVAVKLSSQVSIGSKKEPEIRELSLVATVKPDPGELLPLVQTPLMDIIMKTCRSFQREDHVVSWIDGSDSESQRQDEQRDQDAGPRDHWSTQA